MSSGSYVAGKQSDCSQQRSTLNRSACARRVTVNTKTEWGRSGARAVKIRLMRHPPDPPNQDQLADDAIEDELIHSRSPVDQRRSVRVSSEHVGSPRCRLGSDRFPPHCARCAVRPAWRVIKIAPGTGSATRQLTFHRSLFLSSVNRQRKRGWLKSSP